MIRMIWRKTGIPRLFRSLVSAVLAAALTCGLICALGGASVNAEGSAYKPLTVEVPVECFKDTKLSDQTYRIVISPMDSTYPLPDVSSLSIEDGRDSFSITVTEPGTYEYLIRQEKGAAESVIYDETEYELTLFIVDEEEAGGSGSADPGSGADAGGSDGSASGSAERALICIMSVNYAGTDDKPEKIEFVNEEVEKPDTGDDTEDVTEDTDDSEETEVTEDTGETVTTEDTASTEATVTTEDTAASTADDAKVVPGGDGTDISTENENITSEGKTGDGSNVKTGDETKVEPVIAIMTGSLAVVVFLVFLKKRADRKRKNSDSEETGTRDTDE